MDGQGGQLWVVMGVSGCGKSSIGALLAQSLGARFIEGDSFHLPASVAKMTAGIPLDDADRMPWLELLQQEIRKAADAGEGLVLACSSLKRRYRDVLRAGAPSLRFAHLAGSPEVIAVRMSQRPGHFMPTSLLESQFAVLEPLQPDEAGLSLDLLKEPQAIVADILNGR
ncbi:gluconokinase [Massilia endophytica]|uniref:gluconokinase n=1 Tax=Massilia endophytica TaxID=2899220 RepID=UPI001E55FEFD|nr:gluconokinase [Massilia endophytica]UGQ46031.1 gluconokinase [Massilia endophytica]